MANRFLTSTNSGGDVSSGSTVIFGSTLGASNLNPSQAVKTNSLQQLVSSNLDISDVNNLQNVLDTKIGTPFTGTFQATDFRGNSIKDLTDASTVNLTATSIDLVATDVKVNGSNLTNVATANFGLSAGEVIQGDVLDDTKTDTSHLLSASKIIELVGNATSNVSQVADIAGRDAIIAPKEGDTAIVASPPSTYIYNGSAWVLMEDQVVSVAGKQGTVVLDTSDVLEDPSTLYYTDARVNTHLGTLYDQNNGIPQLNGSGKLPTTILDASPLIYQGTWNADTNTPALASGVGTVGHYYIVSVLGATNLDGIADWKVSDWVVFNGTWQKVDNTDQVISVAGRQGAVTLDTSDVSEDPTALYYTDTRADNRVQNAIDDVTPSATTLYSSTKIDTDLNTKVTQPTTGFNATPITDYTLTSFTFPTASVISGRTLFVGRQTDLRSIDLSDPTAPVDIQTITANGSGMILSGSTIYKFASGTGVRVIDVTLTGDMKVVYSFNASETVASVATNGRYIYTSNNSNIKTWENRGNSAVLLNTLTVSCGVLKVNSGNLYSTAPQKIIVLSLADPSNPQEYAPASEISPNAVNHEDIVAQEGFVYSCQGGGGKVVKADARDPENIPAATVVDLVPGGLAWRLVVQGDYLFISRSEGGLWMVRTSDLSLVQYQALAGSIFDYESVFAFSHYVGIIRNKNPVAGVVIFDVNNITSDFLEVAGLESGQINTRANLSVGQDANIGGALSVGGGFICTSDSVFTGNLAVADNSFIHGCLETNCIRSDGVDIQIENKLDIQQGLEIIGGSVVGIAKSDVGLGSVPNTDFTTPVADNTTHRGRTDNPHTVTKTQVGLGSVPDTDFTTPVADNTTHRGRIDNPHTVTKAQVGLGNVDNESKADMFDNAFLTGKTFANRLNPKYLRVIVDNADGIGFAEMVGTVSATAGDAFIATNNGIPIEKNIGDIVREQGTTQEYTVTDIIGASLSVTPNIVTTFVSDKLERQTGQMIEVIRESDWNRGFSVSTGGDLLLGTISSSSTISDEISINTNLQLGADYDIFLNTNCVLDVKNTAKVEVKSGGEIDIKDGADFKYDIDAFEMYIEGNTTETTITSTNIWTKVNFSTGVSGSVVDNNWTINNTGIATYNGSRPRFFKLACTISTLCKNGKEYEFALLRDGVPQTGTITSYLIGDASRASSLCISAIGPKFTSGDTIELFVRNLESTDGCTVRHFNFSGVMLPNL